VEFLYLDDKLCVCVKPAGVLSTDEPGGLPSLVREALGGKAYTVHRLDRAVGGVMVLARTRHAAADLSAQVSGRGMEKEYLAVVRGTTPAAEGRLTDLLARDAAARRTYIAAAPGPEVREAALDYVRLEEREGLTLVRVKLLTGRTHQIRAQFSGRGTPLAGDVKYGAGPAPYGVALWSHHLGFKHPKTGERLTFTAPPPAAEPWSLFHLL